ncbi:lectin [Cognatilysobacter lacus]|uniref:Lectin n=1 Tax=Cognatilysobacter lacus TaxID=1643323 RepID=A0A5D8Z6Q3_9GAMM|nr:lectin [Lysobacter lacus]TZF90461.1 lectin [Lysobacter lacus]
MKPIALLPFLIALGACARTDPAPGGNPAAPAAAATAAPSAIANEDAPVRKDVTADPQATDTPAPAVAPPGTRGIAVGEPHPSSAVRVDAGPPRYDGYGDLRFGMSVAEARKAWKGALDGDDVTSGCGYLHAAGSAAGPSLMFDGGRFVRYDMRGANAVAPGGGRVGLSADDIRRLYAGRVTESPHKYVEGGRYLRVSDPDSGNRALLFEVDAHGKVSAWRAGRAPQVDYVEGCS